MLCLNGGQTGIRTLETVARLHAFQACAFDHSATCPQFHHPDENIVQTGKFGILSSLVNKDGAFDYPENFPPCLRIARQN